MARNGYCTHGVVPEIVCPECDWKQTGDLPPTCAHDKRLNEECSACGRIITRTIERLKHDAVNHPKHYTSHPSGVECIEITRHMGFNLGNALKYIWRADLKDNAIEDLEKAAWYIADELKKRKQE